MERCTGAPKGFECLKFARHMGECDCVSTEAFNTSMQLSEDEFLYGNSYALRNDDGSLTRLDPTKMVMYQARPKPADQTHLKLVDAQLLNSDALKVIEQFLPNIGKCFGVDMQLLNETLIGLRKQ